MLPAALCGMDDLTLKLACCVVSAVLYLEFCARFSSTFISCSSSYFTPFCSYSYFYSAVDGFQSRLQPIPISIMVPLQSLSFSSKFSFFTFTFSKTKSSILFLHPNPLHCLHFAIANIDQDKTGEAIFFVVLGRICIVSLQNATMNSNFLALSIDVGLFYC